MKKTRVPKGEKYWYLYLGSRNVVAVEKVDYHNSTDDDYFRSGNYFAKKESAEAMADKLRRVLKGADVIEFPKESEQVSEWNEHKTLCREEGFPYDNEMEGKAGWTHCYDWLKSKIVK